MPNPLIHLKVKGISKRTKETITGYYYYNQMKERHYIKTWNNSIEVEPDTVVLLKDIADTCIESVKDIYADYASQWRPARVLG